MVGQNKAMGTKRQPEYILHLNLELNNSDKVNSKSVERKWTQNYQTRRGNEIEYCTIEIFNSTRCIVLNWFIYTDEEGKSQTENILNNGIKCTYEQCWKCWANEDDEECFIKSNDILNSDNK